MPPQENLTCYYVNTETTKIIPLFETDSDTDIQQRMLCTGEFLPIYVFLPKDQDTQTIINEPKTHKLLDLGLVFRQISSSPYEKLSQIYNKIYTQYHIPLIEYIRKWVFYELSVILQNDPKSNIQLHLLSIRSPMDATFFEKFDSPLIDIQTKRRVNRVQFINELTSDWYEETKRDFDARSETMMEKNNESIKIGERFLTITPVDTSPIEELGKIVILNIENAGLTTGTLFNTLSLTTEFPIARYKGFYKIRTDAVFEPLKDETVPDFYSLSLFSKEGRLTVYVQNTSKGLQIQCILSNESGLSTYKDLFSLLRIEETQNPIVNEKSVGLLAEFFIENPMPKKEYQYRWSAFQAPILANIIMNDPLFSRFISVNDTDKISRQNNSLYIYFYDPSKTKTDKEDIVYVGGWNRIISRFGDLAAILTPLQVKPNEFKIHVKITRSSRRETLEKFHYVLSRLVKLYNENYEKEVSLFQSVIHGYKTIYIEPLSAITVRTGLSSVDPVLFPSNIYGRKCQNPKPMIITEEEASELPDARKLHFPPMNAGGVPPRWFTCPTKAKPWETDQTPYPYPGFVRFKHLPDHPFQIAPCCFKEDHTLKNKKEIEKIRLKFEKNVYEETPEEDTNVVVYMPKNLYKVKSDKIIDRCGQLGVLPESIHTFLQMVHPGVEYCRIGIPPGWKNETVLACLEYVDAVKKKKGFFRSASTLRQLLLEQNLDVALQQNYDIGTEGIRHILQDAETYLDISRFYRLFEEFYEINILVVYRDREQGIHWVKPRFIKSFYWSFVSSRPLVILYQHYGGTTDATHAIGNPHCEVVGFVHPKTNILHVDFLLDSSLKTVMELVFSTFKGNQWNGPQQIPSNDPFALTLDSQIIDGLGKTRALLFTEARYIGVLMEPIAPLVVPSLQRPSLIRNIKDVYAFLKSIDAVLENEIQQYHEYLFLTVKAFVPLIFIARATGFLPDDAVVHTLAEKPPCLDYVLPESTSLFSTMNEMQRTVDILQDYLLILLSAFLSDYKTLLVSKSIPEIIESFLEEKVTYRAHYEVPEPSRVSVLVHGNSELLFSDDSKLILPTSFRTKISYFLQWFLAVKSNDVESMKNLRELPSYFQHIDNFLHLSNHLIQTSLLPVTQTHDYHFLQEPLSEIPLLEKMTYYYNPEETPYPHPYMLVTSKHPEDLQKAGYQYLIEGKELKPTISSPKLDTYFSKRPTYKNWKKIGNNPQMALYKREKEGYIGLFPFS